MSDGSQTTRLLAIAVIMILVGVVIGYGVASLTMVPKAEYDRLVETTVSEEEYDTLLGQYNSILTLVPKIRIKAGFIYVGPTTDYGWSYAHEQARQYVATEFSWLETVYFESVAEADAERYISRLVEDEDCDIVFTTSFGFMDATIAAGEDYPDTAFFHCSGYLRSANVGTYFADFYQIYYLNGLMAGALTKTGKVGYVGAYPIPEVIRHINAFALGVREVNPTATISVRWINAWYDPTRAREAAEALIAEGCDALAFTEDSPTVLQVAEEHTLAGDQIYAFSHYSPMLSYAPNSCVSGQLVHWEKLYEEILARFYLGLLNNTNLANVDYLYNLGQSGVELGSAFSVPINPTFISDLQAVNMVDPLLGTINVYDLVMTRLEQMSEPSVIFDPYTGPIKDQLGTVRVPAGTRATYEQLWTINWFVEGIIGTTG